jgi:hypothetical protein
MRFCLVMFIVLACAAGAWLFGCCVEPENGFVHEFPVPFERVESVLHEDRQPGLRVAFVLKPSMFRWGTPRKLNVVFENHLDQWYVDFVDVANDDSAVPPAQNLDEGGVWFLDGLKHEKLYIFHAFLRCKSKDGVPADVVRDVRNGKLRVYFYSRYPQ